MDVVRYKKTVLLYKAGKICGRQEHLFSWVLGKRLRSTENAQKTGYLTNHADDF